MYVVRGMPGESWRWGRRVEYAWVGVADGRGVGGVGGVGRDVGGRGEDGVLGERALRGRVGRRRNMRKRD